MAEKELYALSEICMVDIFIHIIRTFYVGTDHVDHSSSTLEVRQKIENLKQE